MTEEKNAFEQKKSRKTYDKETKKKALALLKKKETKDVSQKLDIPESVLKSWKLKELGKTLGATAKESVDRKADSKTVLELKQQIEALKKEKDLLTDMVAHLYKRCLKDD